MPGSSSDKAADDSRCQNCQSVSTVEHAIAHPSISIDSAVHFSGLLILTEVDPLSNAGLTGARLVQTIGPAEARSAQPWLLGLVALDRRGVSCNSLNSSLNPHAVRYAKRWRTRPR